MPTTEPAAMPTAGALLREGIERFRAAGSESPRLDAELLLADVLGTDRTRLIAHPEDPIGPGPAGRYAAHLDRREAGEPVAYIRGLKEFHGLAFTVDRRALIPRPETELLVDLAHGWLVERLISRPRPAGTPLLAVADVGTGSGAVAVALAVALRRAGMAGEVAIVASDVAPGAADLARENAVAHATADRVGVLVADLLPPAGAVAGALAVPDRFDLVAANLPYVPSAIVPVLPVAATFEPAGALDGGPDGLDVVRRLLTLLPARLATDGVAFLEIGADQGPGIHAAVEAILPGWACAVAPDLAGRPRVAQLERVGQPPG